jgi:hypothetical protein
MEPAPTKPPGIPQPAGPPSQTAATRLTTPTTSTAVPALSLDTGFTQSSDTPPGMSPRQKVICAEVNQYLTSSGTYDFPKTELTRQEEAQLKRKLYGRYVPTPCLPIRQLKCGLLYCGHGYIVCPECLWHADYYHHTTTTGINCPRWICSNCEPHFSISELWIPRDIQP